MKVSSRPLADDVSHGGNVFGVISASYTDLGGAGGVPALTTVEQTSVRQKRQEVEFVLEQSGTNVATTNDPEGGGQHRGSLSNGDWIALNGHDRPAAHRLTHVPRGEHVDARCRAGQPAAAVEVQARRGRRAGPDDGHDHVDRRHRDVAEPDVPITDPGGPHKVYLVFRSIAGGQTGNNLFNLNWVQFDGQGVSVP